MKETTTKIKTKNKSRHKKKRRLMKHETRHILKKMTEIVCFSKREFESKVRTKRKKNTIEMY